MAVLRACDADDGLKDGIVGNPLKCSWDPAELACRAGQDGDECLSSEQAAGLRRAYANVKAGDGATAIFGLPRGSELISVPLFASLTDNLPNAVGMSNLRAVQFENPDYDFANWDPPRDLDQQRTTPYAFMLDATNPDLSRFLAHGGKLILWHGLYDGLPRAADSIDYFQTMDSHHHRTTLGTWGQRARHEWRTPLSRAGSCPLRWRTGRRYLRYGGGPRRLAGEGASTGANRGIQGESPRRRAC